ncbi:hypothetical protein HDE_00512 [Halotydeus destructor]|nr:hypothetical protein HDE_00512 [Halotydeus destructor]
MTVYIVVICIFILVYFFIQKLPCHPKQPAVSPAKPTVIQPLAAAEKVHAAHDQDGKNNPGLEERSPLSKQQPQEGAGTGDVENLHNPTRVDSKPEASPTHHDPTSVGSINTAERDIVSYPPKVDLSRDSTRFTIPSKPFALPKLSTMNLVPVFTTQSFINKTSLFALVTEPAGRGFYNFISVGSGDLRAPGDAILIAGNSLYDDDTLATFGPASATVRNVAPTYVEKTIRFWKFPHHSYVQSRFVFCLIFDPETKLTTSWFASHANFFVNLDDLISYALRIDKHTVLESNCRYFFATGSSSVDSDSFESFLSEILTTPETSKLHFSVLASNGAILSSLREEAQQLILNQKTSLQVNPENTKRLLELLFSDILAASPLDLVSRKIEDLSKIDQNSGFPTLEALNTLNLLESIGLDDLAKTQILPISQYPFST